MAQLGILEGRFLPGNRQRPGFGGTLASSRSRRSIGPTLGDDGLSTWIYNAKFFVNQKWAKIESDQIASTGKGLTSAQKVAWDAELAQAEVQARAAYAAQSGTTPKAPPPAGPSAAAQAAAAAAAAAAAQSAARGYAAQAMYNTAKSAALNAGLSAGDAETVAKAAAQAVAAGGGYDYTAAIARMKEVYAAQANKVIPVNPGVNAPGTVNPPQDVTTATPMPNLMTQEQLRQYYDVPQSPSPSSPSAPADAPPPSASPQDALRHTYEDSAAGAASNAPVTPKSFIVPLAALAAAYFFLKG